MDIDEEIQAHDNLVQIKLGSGESFVYLISQSIAKEHRNCNTQPRNVTHRNARTANRNNVTHAV
jgi:hypothetical protein